MKKEQRICVVDTVYTLFLYLLKFGYNENDFFIFSDGIPKSIKDNIPHYYFPSFRFNLNNDFNIFKKIFINVIPFFKQLFEILKLRWAVFFKTRNKTTYVYGQGHINFSFPLYEFENNALIEDGVANYYDLDKPTKYHPILEKLFHFFGFYTYSLYEGFGTHDNINKIYLTRDNAPEIIKDKVEVFSPDELWQSKSSMDQKKILSLFNAEGFNDLKDDCVILLTEPFSEDGLISFNEEINLYKSIIETEEGVIIKTHPRETKDYSSLFPNTEVIDVPFPVELFKFMNISIKKIITFGSSAALNLEGYCEIEFYDKTSSKLINDACALFKKFK